MLDGVEHFERWKSNMRYESSWLHLYYSLFLLTINVSSLHNEKHISPEFTKTFVEPTKAPLNWSTRKDCNQVLGSFRSAPVI